MLVLVEKDSIEPWPVVSTIWVQAIEFDSYFGYYGLSLTLKTQQLMQYEAARDIAVEFNSVPGHHISKHLTLSRLALPVRSQPASVCGVAENRSQHCPCCSHAILADTVGITLQGQLNITVAKQSLYRFGVNSSAD